MTHTKYYKNITFVIQFKYYIEKRKKWSAQYTITVGDKQVRKTNYKCK